MVIMKNSKLPNIASSTVLPCNVLLPVLCSFIAYWRTFIEADTVFLHEAMVVDIRRDLNYAKVITNASAEPHHHYICVARLCILSDDILPSPDNLNKMDTVMGNITTRSIRLGHLSVSQLRKMHRSNSASEWRVSDTHRKRYGHHDASA